MKECPACRRCFPDDVGHCPNDGDATIPSISGEPVLDARYQLERRLGQGGMGAVFQARHIFLKTFHAIKIILPDLVGNDPMLVTRFRQEAMAAAAIHHQNIIAVTDFGVVRGTMPFLVMEFVKGRSLHDLLAEEKRLSPARALELMSPVCAGMAAAHRQNIVHRDLKPLNILMQDNAPVSEGLKICDFGLAKIKSGELLGSFVQAKTSGLMGSPFYMAPEQWSDEEPDVRADIYSLGVILYQMLGGDVPFRGASVPSIMKKHLTMEPPPLNSLGVTVPPEIEAVVRHALQKEAADRPATVLDFLEELRHAVTNASASLDGTQVGFVPAESKTIISAPLTTTPKQSRELATIVSLHTDPPQSRVFINNISVGVSDSAGDLVLTDLPRGLHRLRVAHEGYADWEQQIECNGGDCRVNAQLHSLLIASQPHLTGDPFATITGDAHNKASLEQPSLPPPAAHDSAAKGSQKEVEESGPVAGVTTGTRGASEGPQAGEAERTAAAQSLRERQALDAQERESWATTPIIKQAPPTTPLQSAPLENYLTTRVMDNNSLPAVEQQAVLPQVQPSLPGHAPGLAEAGRKKSSMPLVMVGVVVLLVIIGGGVGAYFLLHKTSSPPPPPQSRNVNGPTEKPSQTEPVKAEMVSIPGGAFKMGRNDGTPPEMPAHSVNVGPFWIDRTEVTNAEYAQFVRETKHAPPENWEGDKPPTGQEQWPVSNVSFDDAEAFAAWRSKSSGATYRLPTEEEWEYAARNGEQGNLYPWGNNWLNDHAGIKDSGISSPRAVGSYPSGQNRWGVQDLIGNVWEWTSSKASVYPGNPGQLPPGQKDWVVIRGGSFLSEASGERAVTSTFRDWVSPSRKHPTLGFRLVRAGP